jgi:GT2 family glycosyltransferase
LPITLIDAATTPIVQLYGFRWCGHCESDVTSEFRHARSESEGDFASLRLCYDRQSRENIELSSPRVSIIIPCYNTAHLVSETLQSVFKQTYNDYEVIVVNDGSPDTPELERVLTPWLDRVVYVKTENYGLAGARNNGIRASRGELIALLDSDDLWEPNYLDVQVRELDKDPTVDIVSPGSFDFENDPETGAVCPNPRGEVTFASLVQGTRGVMVSVLARRSALERAGLFDDTLRSCEDFDMWLRCLKSGSRIFHHAEVLVRYRRRKDSLSSEPVWMLDNAIKVLQKANASLPLTQEERKLTEAAIVRFEGNQLFEEGKRAFLQGDIPAAIDCLKQANTRLHSLRIRMIVSLLRIAPSFARVAYAQKFK